MQAFEKVGRSHCNEECGTTCNEKCAHVPNLKASKDQYGLGSEGLNVCHSLAKHSAGILVLDNQSALHMSRFKSLVET